MNEFLNVNLATESIKNDDNKNQNNNIPESTRSSIDLEKLNYFAKITDNENLKQNFLNDNLFPIELVRDNYSPSIDAPMTIKEVVISALYLGITNFGVMQVKEKKTFLYFVVEKKFMDEYTFINLFAICELLPGATLIQILLCVYYIKTLSFLITFLGIICFLLPGVFCLTIVYLLISKFINVLYEYKFFLIVEIAVAQSGFALLLNFLMFQFKKLLNSNFQSGIVIITVGTLLVKDNLLIMLLLFLIMGYLSMKKSEHENLVHHLDETINNAVRYYPYYRYISILIYFIFFFGICFLSYILKVDYQNLCFKFYTMGSLIFMDYSTINFLDSYLDLDFKQIIISFGFICLFQGHIFNLLIVLMMDQGLLYMLLYLGILYLPTILFGYIGLKGIKKFNNSINLKLFLQGMGTTSLGFIFSIVPKIWKCTCFDNKYHHWVFGTLIVFMGWYWFYKRKFLIGNVVTILSSIFLSLLTEHFQTNEKVQN